MPSGTSMPSQLIIIEMRGPWIVHAGTKYGYQTIESESIIFRELKSIALNNVTNRD